MSKKPTSTVKVIRQPVKVKPTTLYSLHLDDLTEREAQSIMTVLNRIGGDPKGLRGLFEGMQQALLAQGLTSNDLDCVSDDSDIRFTDIPVVVPLHIND